MKGHMQRLGLAAVSLSVSFSLAPSAFAADFPQGVPVGVPVLRAPSAIVAANWDGFYIGGNIGGGVSSGGYTFNNGTFSEAFNWQPGGFIGGFQAGLQAQWGHWLIGLEGTYQWTGYDETTPSGIAGGNLSQMDIKYLGALSGKLGYAFDRTLFYGKVGWAFSRTHNFYATPAGNIDLYNWDNGFTVGTGIEYQLTPNWVAGLAFDYYRFTPSRTFTFGGAPGTITNGDVNLYSFTARISYLFNWWGR